MDCIKVIDFRIDANTYRKDYIETEKLLELKKTLTIEQLSSSVQNFGAYSLCNLINFFDSGIPFLMTENIRHNYIDWSIHKYVDSISHELLYKSHCHRNQLLVTMAGEYLGRVAVYDKDEVCSSNQAIAKVTLKPGISPYIVSTFLNSKHGQNQINRLKTITGQPNINMSLIKSLSCPVFSEDFQLKIEQTIISSHKKQEDSKQLYKEAEELLLSELGLLDFIPNDDNIAIKSFSNSFSISGRLDSEYYQPKYDDIEQRIYSKPHTFIDKEFSQITTSFNKTKDGYNYIEIGDVNVSDGVHSYNYVVTEELPANAKIKVANGDLIVSTVRPYRGAVSIINTDDTDLVVSGAFTVLRAKPENNYRIQVLQVLLRTQVYKDFMLKYNVGSSYPVIKDENIMNLPIPLLCDKVQEFIEAKIKESFVLKEQSKQLLELAKRAVEVAIEDSEDSAFKLIGDNKCHD